MRRRITYVLGGPLQSELESSKVRGCQPLAEFNVFAFRNGARLAGTEQVRPGSPVSLRRRIALARFVSRHRGDYDMLVASGEDIGFPLTLLGIAQRAPRPLSIIVHGSYFGGAKFNAAAPLLRAATHASFLCLSESLRHRLVDIYGFPAGRCHNIGYAVDTAFFRPGAACVSPLILSAGSANRDYRTLIAAARGLDATLRIAADSLWRPQASEPDPAPAGSFVEIGSAGDYLALRALYERASFVVVPLHPARFASGYAVIAEAMAMGKAVITTATEAASDLVLDGVTGFYTQPADVCGLRDRMRLLLEDPARAQAMGQAGAKRMQESFNLEAYCATIERVIGLDARANR